MSSVHEYTIEVEWTGNSGSGTSSYTSYDRSHEIRIAHKEPILASSDKAFRGDGTEHNPEDLFVSAIASCHMLWYLHLCADKGILVESYNDSATGLMETTENGDGRFVALTLRPEVVVRDETMINQAIDLHEKAHQMCFLANSVNFKIIIESNVKSPL